MNITVKDFNLADTVESGQLFRWEKKGNGYVIRNGGKSFYAEQENPKTLSFDGVDEPFIREFFDLSTDYGKIKKTISAEKLAPIIEKHPGIRIVRQDPWECTIGFICSSNSNITRIRNNMNSLTTCFGKGHVFPMPSDIKQGAKLDSCRLGYRAEYVRSISKQITPEFLHSLKNENYANAKEKLMELPGIGPKVADCICLFALGFTEAFPVDTHIQQAMAAMYGVEKEKEIRAFAAKKWGKLAGYAQQYIFHWRRTTS